ncbi:vanadium-dependent haloperoxidase [Nocardiopsis sp. EMB25]|uniref:vanadium-dependent haloperoxidase n=1 Tax=Nocardiopsis sp. EMB25 TaxID=2835867 RepID=UPI0022839DDE|nr:vanadium-dependent haloperoxidase [Nocardiopsis sp. EMB25]MCY9784883.1 vanadium-dependent haloperoxidase [Nocardiopsis sp. EMB25]
MGSVESRGKFYLTDTSDLIGGREGALDPAIDHAAYTTLDALFPRLDFSEDLRVARGAYRVGSRDHDLGRRAGLRTARAMLRHRRDDGWNRTVEYVPVLEPGHWRPNPGVPVIEPHWGRVRPFVLRRGSQLRPEPWGGFESTRERLASELYAEEVELVRTLGGADSTERTPDQTEMARFWANDLDGTYKLGQLYEHTGILVRAHRPYATTFETARLFTLHAVAIADVVITAWDAKFETEVDHWRPHHAIRMADTDGNYRTSPDPDWQPLSADTRGRHFAPNHPSYLSGHASVAGAWAGAVSHHFGTADLDYRATTDDPHAVGVTRHLPSITAAAQEVADSRLYAGCHYRLTNERSLEHGYEVAEHVVRALD